MALLTIELLGAPRLFLDDQPLDPHVRKELALLAFLAVEQERRHSRDRLLDMFWPEVPLEAARNNLRVVLAGLRRLLGAASDTVLRTDRQYMQFLSASDHALDVARFRALLAEVQAHAHAAPERCDACVDRLTAAVTLYRNDFLSDFSLSDSIPFEEWATIQREVLHQQQLDALDTLTTACELRGDYAAQCRYARRQLALEAWRETAHAQLIRGLWASGQRRRAQEQYEACQRTLAAELGAEPSPELTALYQQLSSVETSRATTLQESATLRHTAPLHNLPTQVTSFIGRETQLDALEHTLGRSRLITLTGTGGCGKTRLALELATIHLPSYTDGVWWVALEPLRDPALVPQAVAETLGLPTASTESASQLLSAALRSKHLLLLLDNCEHLVAACRHLAEQLLRDCPRVTILATSREMLRVRGEEVWQVPPLSAPTKMVATPDQLLSYNGIQLFVERARSVRAGFTLNPRNAPAVIQICQQLDGLPLALELAAARVRHMDVETIAARLDDRFSLLTGGSYPTARQQRLRAAVDWSYALLDDTERMCFCQLALFAGGFTLEMAEDVVREPNSLRQGEASTIELLLSLIDKSLVVAEQHDAGMRYRLLETIRVYARDQLLQSGEAEAIGARHAAAFLRLAEQAEAQFVGAEQIIWLDRIAVEHANLRTAIDWLREHNQGVAALRLVTALRYFWRVRGYYAEGIELLNTLLVHATEAANATVRARALNAAGYLEFVRGQQDNAHDLLEEALAIGRAVADSPTVAFALRYLGALAYGQQAFGDARAYGEESLAIYRSLDATNDVAGSSMYLGDIALAQGDYDRAEALYAESVAILRVRHNLVALPYPLRRLGYLALRRGYLERAASLCAESLQHNLTISDQQGVAACLVGLAASAAAATRFAYAAQLLGHADSLLESLHSRLLPFDRTQYQHVQQILAKQLGAAEYAASCEIGRAMTIVQLLAQPEALFEQASSATEHTHASTETAEHHHALDPAPGDVRDSPPHNLPSPLTSFVGRASERAKITTFLMDDTRLVTLLGPGGTGKTRLALAIGWHLLPQFSDGVWWIALAGIQATDDLALQRNTLGGAVATALGHSLSGRRDPLDELAATLRDHVALLVFDNCEHLPVVADVVYALLEAAPTLRIVATSREPLGLRGEMLVRLDGLPVPSTGAVDAASYSSVQLFVQRAARHAPSLELHNATDAVARLCRLVDGLPLAIELAAHWVEHYTPAEITEAIQTDLGFLAARTRDLSDRHRSMRAVFDYSWRSLHSTEQGALMRLAVFRGSFDRVAAQTIAQVRADTLAVLVDKSLVQQISDGRYSLHELLRQFAAERLDISGDAAATHAHHAAYYLALAEQATPELAQPDQALALERVDRALDNLRAALSWFWEQGQTASGMRLAGALERFWFTRGYFSEGREWLERFLRLTNAGDVSPTLRAQVLSTIGLLANTQGDHTQATRWLEQSLACYHTARDPVGTVRVLTTLGGVAYDQGDLHGAIARWEQSLAQARETNDLGEIARALGNLGEAYFHLHNLAKATALHTEALTFARQAGRTNLEAFQLGDLGNVARIQGDLVQAKALHKQALELKRSLGARRQIAISLEDLASVAAAENDGARAACLLGAAATIREQIGTPQAAPERIASEQVVQGARTLLGEHAWAAAFIKGRTLSVDQAITYALE